MSVLLYVDDLLYSGQIEEIKEFEKQMNKSFKLKTMEKVQTFVELKFGKLQDNVLTINQEERIEKITRRFKLENMKERSTPLSPNELKSIGERKLTDLKLYQSLVGSINYFAGFSRPDVSYSSHYLSRFLTESTETLLKRAKRVMNYLYKRRKLKSKVFPMKEVNNVKMLVDTSYAPDEDRKSVTGFLLFLNNTLVANKSKKQPIITMSSTEAEYVGLSLALNELKFALLILEEMNMEYIVDVFMDSQSAIRIVKNKEVNGRTKHLDTH
eukprot:snap_masked-scaffold_1-processed-gene-23.56-mRNA-1 protein AED:0.49 eAED:0.49 QI:0/-1/0/1/-1/1/1/0/268